MSNPFFRTLGPIRRRQLLRGAGVAIGLPFLDAMTPTFAQRAPQGSQPAPRFVAMCAGLGFHGPFLFPQQQGREYTPTPYLEKLQEFRQDFTIFSGLSHPNQNGNNGHASEMTWLTSATRPGLAGFRNTISLDQLIAEKVGPETRFPYLVLTNGSSLSWTANGVNIPGESRPSRVFRRLFVDGTEKEIDAQVQELKRGRSVLDTVLGDARRLNKRLQQRDRQKLDEYFESIRALEQRITQLQAWARRPKPKVDYQEPQDVADRKDILARQRLMYDMIVLALQTDSTRAITFSLGALNAVPVIPGVKTDWHNLSHHGKDESKIDELKVIEAAEFEVFAEFLGKLKSVTEPGGTLLDHTSVLFGSNLGNASAHDWRNLPIILAGGGYRHGGYVAHDAKNNTPLANLFVSLAQRMGVETDQFGSSTSAGVRGLATA